MKYRLLLQSIFLCITCSMLSLMLIGEVQAQILECRDQDGKKMFAVSCPKGYKQAREVEILKPASETKEVKYARAAKLKAMYDRDAQSRARRVSEEEEAAVERDKQRKFANQCHEDKKLLSSLLLDGPYVVGKESDGTPIHMEEEKRLARIKELGENIKKCPVE